MKQYFLRGLAFGLICALTYSATIQSSAEPEKQPIVNATWGQALKKSGREGIDQALFVFKYFKLPALAFSYFNPNWGVSRFFSTLSNTKDVAHGIAVSYATTAIALRYKKQIVESCDNDEETAEALMMIAPIAGFLLPTKVSTCAALALVAALQTKEWLGKRRLKQAALLAA